MANDENAVLKVMESIPQAFFDLIARIIPGYLALVFIYVIKDYGGKINLGSIGSIILEISHLHWIVILVAVWVVGLIIDAAARSQQFDRLVSLI